MDLPDRSQPDRPPTPTHYEAARRWHATAIGVLDRLHADALKLRGALDDPEHPLHAYLAPTAVAELAQALGDVTCLAIVATPIPPCEIPIPDPLGFECDAIPNPLLVMEEIFDFRTALAVLDSDAKLRALLPEKDLRELTKLAAQGARLVEMEQATSDPLVRECDVILVMEAVP